MCTMDIDKEQNNLKQQHLKEITKLLKTLKYFIHHECVMTIMEANIFAMRGSCKNAYVLGRCEILYKYGHLMVHRKVFLFTKNV